MRKKEDVSLEVLRELFLLRDEKYKEFHCKLIPTVNPEFVIGVRIPDLKKFAISFNRSSLSKEFLKVLPHKYYEENNLHGFLISFIKDFDACVLEVNKFLPYIDNWATCDSLFPKVFKKHLSELLEYIKVWIYSSHVYTIRFGVLMLMKLYLDDNFKAEYLELVSNIHSNDYYVNMMISWYFATALTKQYSDTILYIENKRLDKFVHNKTIQKALESYRISDEIKLYLRTLKI